MAVGPIVRRPPFGGIARERVAEGLPTVHLAASMGGHLELLMRLEPAFEGYRSVWVTAAAGGADSLRENGVRVCDVPRFNRSRRTSVLTNVAGSFLAALRERPRVVIASGAGSVVAFCVFARLLGARIVFLETMARVTSPSASGRVLSRIASKVFVQWPEMAHVYRNAVVCRPALWEDVRARARHRSGGTFVAVGTHRHPFDRLLSAIDRAVEADLLPGPVVVQTGVSGYRPSNYEARAFMSPEELADAMEGAEYVICHAGSGIISAALRSGHKPLVMPRRAEFGEHVDDHQVQIVDKLSMLDLVVPLDGDISAADLTAAQAGVDRPTQPAGGSVGHAVSSELAEIFTG